MDVAFARYFVNASQNEVNGRTSSYNIINGMAPESYSCCLRRKVIQWPFENGTHTMEAYNSTRPHYIARLNPAITRHRDEETRRRAKQALYYKVVRSYGCY